MKHLLELLSLAGMVPAMALLGCSLTHPASPAPAVHVKSVVPAGQEVMFARSIVSMGDTARLERVLAKARRGEPLTLGFIGGSITEGALATSADKCWAARTAAWWRETFPQTKFTFINAGIGATGSDIGAHRVQADLLSQRPDFVVAEFAVNDGDQYASAETMEGLTRQILSQPDQPALMYLFMSTNTGNNAQQWHSIIGRHYGIPMVSERDAVWPEMQAGRLKWESVVADIIHPNDKGHQLCADLVAGCIEKVLVTLPEDAKLPPVGPLPAPTLSDVYEHTALANADSIKPVRNEGWHAGNEGDIHFGNGWFAERPGSVLEFEAEGKILSVMYHVVKRDMGKAAIQLDDLPPVTVNGWFGETWGGYNACLLLGRDLSPGKHRIRVTVLDEKDPGSTGHKFWLRAILSAGVPARP